MGCATSKKEVEDGVVSLCKDRKRLLKLAVERRYALADAQCKYNQSLYAVAAAIRLFVARHSSPSSPFLITFPATETPMANSMFFQQKPTEPTHETIHCQSSLSTVFLKRGGQYQGQEEGPRTEQGKEGCLESSEEEEEDGVICEHFYGEEAPPAIPSPEKEFAWDFFNPFDEVRTRAVSSFSDSSQEELRAVREKEGIPDLEEEGERKVENATNADHDGDGESKNKNKSTNLSNGDGHDANICQGEKNSFRMIKTPTARNERELLEALKDVEDHFLRAYESGLDVCRMLEANRVQLQSGLEEFKESSSKIIRSITSSRSPLSRSSSSKSLVSCSSRSSFTWTELKTDMFDDYGGMESGSHSLTLGRLYAWEKKLYEEVKAADQTRKTYDQKCSQMRNRIAKRDGLFSGDKTRAEVKDLHSRILVAIRSAETISERIEKLRDEELQPQLIELLHGLMRNWKIMMELHETQNRIMFEVTSFNCPAYGKFCNDSHRLATLQLVEELHNWRSCFAAYLSAQKEYIEALSGWLSKFISPEVELRPKKRSSVPALAVDGPPLLATCLEWLASLEKLPNEAVVRALKSFGKDMHALWVQQGEEQKQKRKVDGLAKELERKVLAFQRTEHRVLSSKLSEQELEVNVRSRIEYLAERKNLLDTFRKRVDTEKLKHQTVIEETQQITVKGFQTGFYSVFESLVEFSKAYVKMYADLVTHCETAKAPEKEDEGEPSYVDEMSSYLWG
ncbi:protein ALTERED PHOSPHATE STARVATION RESPONSE 1-like [Hibiscus syriacus]|uniref:protein ALTERED PHOSPHATE STARVATION RESPONSE 1-like n=1 Tax=Hibiscus syriacus TaxID=106335 RepID=UPI001920DDA9|nr:protein ALTERED PHOSPHATE STARVATION RESPONSE 1-like [Hibiscus syriacus]XP_038994764.1 protein ALTERED PHOSPHATE STARVATION RESPONSE 1-like [Hibiscus syriacus]